MTIQTFEPTPLSVPAAPSEGLTKVRETAELMVLCKQVADAVAGTGMMPRHLRGKPEEAAAVMMYGATLGLDPMQSVRLVYEVHGQPGLYARTMDALVKAAGHRTWTVASSDDAVTVAGQRRGTEHVEEVTWTIDRAKKAGYTKNDKYQSDPQSMLHAKATAEVCRKIAPDVLAGVYSVEEIQSETKWEAEVTSVTRSTDALRGALGNTPAPVAAEPPAPVTATSPDAITSGQQKKLGALMREAGITEREQALLYVGDTIGRPVQSRNELTKVEAGQVIESLEADLLPVEGEPA